MSLSTKLHSSFKFEKVNKIFENDFTLNDGMLILNKDEYRWNTLMNKNSKEAK